MCTVPEELKRRVEQHFTAGELADFLDLDVDQILDAFPLIVSREYANIVDEVCFELDEDDE